jgi:Tol biopolymer transport system component
MASRRFLLTAVVLLAFVASYPTAAPKYSDWGAPVSLGPVVNSLYNDAGPAISKDGLSLFFGSDRPGGSGGYDIWVSQRASRDAAWGAPVNLGPALNSANLDNVPALSRDEHWMFFNSDRPGGSGQNDLWASYRAHTKDDFGWEPPVNLASLNTAFLEQGSGYFENEEVGAPLLFFNSDRPGGAGAPDIYVSQLMPDGFGPPTRIAELSSPASDNRPSVRFDGLEVVLFSNRAGSFGGADLWSATRETVFDSWSTPVNLGPVVNSVVNDIHPYIASDRRTLYFASPRAGGFGMIDLYVSTRVRQ